jgi:hypothetical protein
MSIKTAELANSLISAVSSKVKSKEDFNIFLTLGNPPTCNRINTTALCTLSKRQLCDTSGENEPSAFCVYRYGVLQVPVAGDKTRTTDIDQNVICESFWNTRTLINAMMNKMKHPIMRVRCE